MPIDPAVPQCEHVKFDGIRCGSPAMKSKHFCYHHSRIRRQKPDYAVPFPDSSQSVAYAAHYIVQLMLDGKLTPPEARAALYGVRVIQLALKHVQEPPPDAVVTEDPNDVRYEKNLKEIGIRDKTGDETIALLKDRVKFG